MAQLVGHLTARVRPGEEALVRQLLPARAVPVFDAMPVADRRHGLDVAQRLLARGIDDPDVLAAALLHDAAKGHAMRLWHRVGGVLLEAFAPRSLARLASADPRSWRHGFHLYLHHEALSADAALAAGCPPRVGAFIRGSVPTADVTLAAALRAADDAS
ncbi:MAG: hypothetical protein ABI622_09830 [Chloroflexota bacterium]